MLTKCIDLSSVATDNEFITGNFSAETTGLLMQESSALTTLVQLTTDLERKLTFFICSADIMLFSHQLREVAQRARFLSGAISAKREDHLALIRNRSTIENLVKNFAWHYDLRPFISHFISDVSEQTASLTETLRSIAISSDPELRDPTSYALDDEGVEQLAVDLELAQDIYSNNRGEDFLEASEELHKPLLDSGDANSPKTRIRLGFIRPNSSEQSGSSFEAPFSVHLLLKDWNVGDNPWSYQYRDPYDLSKDHTVPTSPAHNNQPPDLILSRSNTQSNTVLPLNTSTAALSQPTAMTVIPSSQFLGAAPPVSASQIGGSQPIGKKATKKRLGGF